MNPKILELKDKAQSLEAQLNQVLKTMISCVEESAERPLSTYPINDKTSLIEDMRERKKSISLEDLEIQTGVSSSTLKRMLKDPSNTSLDNFLSVASELGMKIWIEK
ncbi:helix-turn-helix domain-containing protein [Vibrio breoganii]|uniref:helix-turn-helix domain-containing protein n=1 Tax=Vibrio breoganii TaxID=553239 RepID=UPI000C81CB5E|nr:helix-turn-helix transcriptional regulator [Vibrio breoganii]PMG94274.1 hypothetical protein BCU79_12370 [Vibrio breoganii]PMI16068.1 hypothetical protein BCU49_01850 [Vibrio breoganii]PMJ46081.1 hypothetical protein BCU21_11890 [Vibrio breoganii]PMK55033.1 hypothetical protein BCT97_00640 [Vibrio breoganii]PMM19843.1 hypothetical protein BCT59_08605 [Vibrio breoganii]